MNQKSFEIISSSLEETSSFGKKLGEQFLPGTLLTLHGDLGSGKTTLVQGIGKGLKIPEEYYITSPTYSIINEYPGEVSFFHVDLYRISDEEELFDLGFEEILASKSIIAVEWPEKVSKDYLKADISIHIEAIDFLSRKFSVITYGHKLSNLIEIFS